MVTIESGESPVSLFVSLDEGMSVWEVCRVTASLRCATHRFIKTR